MTEAWNSLGIAIGVEKLATGYYVDYEFVESSARSMYLQEQLVDLGFAQATEHGQIRTTCCGRKGAPAGWVLDKALGFPPKNWYFVLTDNSPQIMCMGCWATWDERMYAPKRTRISRGDHDPSLDPYRLAQTGSVQ